MSLQWSSGASAPSVTTHTHTHTHSCTALSQRDAEADAEWINHATDKSVDRHSCTIVWKQEAAPKWGVWQSQINYHSTILVRNTLKYEHMGDSTTTGTCGPVEKFTFHTLTSLIYLLSRNHKRILSYFLNRAAKRLIMINHIQNKSLCLHTMCMYCVYLLCIYKYTHIYVYNYIIYKYKYLMYKSNIFFLNIYMYVCIYIYIINIHRTHTNKM